jgi:hypothetical protein
MADLRSQLQAGLSGSYALHHDPLRSNPRLKRLVEGTA